jgi:hypothetical protein
MTQTEAIHLLEPVALTEDVPSLGLARGQVGTAVLQHDDGVFEVEFCDDQGQTYALAALTSEQLLPLRYAPGRAA